MSINENKPKATGLCKEQEGISRQRPRATPKKDTQQHPHYGSFGGKVLTAGAVLR